MMHFAPLSIRNICNTSNFRTLHCLLLKKTRLSSYIIDMNGSFNQSIADLCGVELSALVNSYKYSVFGGHTAVVEGHCGIVGFGSDKVSFTLKNAVLAVCGDNLTIKCLQKRFAVVVGVIRSVEVTYAQ